MARTVGIIAGRINLGLEAESIGGGGGGLTDTGRSLQILIILIVDSVLPATVTPSHIDLHRWLRHFV